MALGGGTFVTQNKVLPGAYINFVSAKSANANLSDRGIATMPLELDWGIEDKVIEVTNEMFEKDSLKIFGYDYTSDKLKGLRDLFKNIRILYAYRLTSGGTKASNNYATAKYSGTRGNDISTIIRKNIDEEEKYDVITMIDKVVVDTQTISEISELKENDFVTFKDDFSLGEEAGSKLSGGTNGEVNGTSYQKYLDKIESYTYNTMGLLATDDTIKSLHINFCKRLRDKMGIKFQLVIYNKAADYYGVVNVKNKVENDLESSLVYYVTGITAGCQVNKSNLNRVYDGEFDINVDYTQLELSEGIKSGYFIFHKVGSDVRVLEDINSQVSVTDERGEVFKSNQTVRVIDQIANDIAVLFSTKYLGKIPNDDAGRVALWTDIVKHHEELQNLRAIEGFVSDDILVMQGDDKKSVVVSDAVTVVNAMAKLYMTVTIS